MTSARGSQEAITPAAPSPRSTRHSCSLPSGSPASRRRASQGSARPWSWLPGTIVTRRSPSASPRRSKKGRTRSSSRGHGRLAQLQHVAQEDDPVRALDGGHEPLERALAARHVEAAGAAEVKIGEDGAAHSQPWWQG